MNRNPVKTWRERKDAEKTGVVGSGDTPSAGLFVANCDFGASDRRHRRIQDRAGHLSILPEARSNAQRTSQYDAHPCCRKHDQSPQIATDFRKKCTRVGAGGPHTILSGRSAVRRRPHEVFRSEVGGRFVWFAVRQSETVGLAVQLLRMDSGRWRGFESRLPTEVSVRPSAPQDYRCRLDLRSWDGSEG